MTDEARTHVMALPEGEQAESSRLCSDPDSGQTVIYHVAAREFPNDQWVCMGCGEAFVDGDA